MDSLGEVGKKMRSAIKAKLIELGNASQSGYIDDELPDYVMIMVANKRSKQQMLTDLNLFLGSNTESFVTWLHQVLQKLQEVTLPSSLASKAKKKVESSTSKKEKKKDKKKSGKEPSITDVIAAELMEKAKRTETIAIKKEEKSRTPTPPPAPLISNDKSPRTPTPPRISSTTTRPDDEFDIPTISEISMSANSHKLHTKELSQLQELQNKINEKLRTQSSEDREDEPTKSPSQKPQSSIASRLGVMPTENSKPSNIIKLSAIRRVESEFVTTTGLKKVVERNKEDNDRRDSRRNERERIDYRDRTIRYHRSNSRDRYRNRRHNSRSRSPIERNERRGRISIRDRIGARVTGNRQSRTPEDSRPKRPALLSVIQPSNPPKHTSKNPGRSMLLRAVAEAQKSTARTFTDDLKKNARDKITIRVNTDKRNRFDDEYVPEPLSRRSESEAEYHPSTNSRKDMDEDDENVVYLNNNDVDLDDLENDTEQQQQQQQQQNNQPNVSPTFIVSLDGVPRFEKNSKSVSKSPTPPPVIKRNKRKSVKERIGVRPIEQLMPLSTDEKIQQPQKRPHVEEEEEEECESQRAYNKVKRTRVSPITFDLTDEENENDDGKSRGSSCDRSLKRTPTKDRNNSIESRENGEEHAKRIRLEPSRSFDHVPALLSSVVVPVTDAVKPIIKSKERCKYYPACTNTNCLFYHPTTPCKAFPVCKFGDSCAYIHPMCKFDISCNRIGCNYTHTPLIAQKSPIVASSIVPVQNYKSIQITPTTTICKFFPKCTNTNCSFLHPKICKFGKGCLNKFDCNFYHFETSSKSKFKWVSPLS